MQDVENLLKQRHLGSQAQIELVLEVLNEQKSLSKKDLLKYCSSKIYGINRSFEGIIELLNCTEFIKTQENIDIIHNLSKLDNIKISIDDIKKEIILKLMTKMSQKSLLNIFFNNITLEVNKGNFYYINQQYKFPSLRDLLIEFGIFKRNPDLKSQFDIADKYKIWFEKNVLPMIDVSRRNSRKISLKELKKRNEIKNKRNEELGREAEEWVLEFEKKRLDNHKNFKNIKMISDDYANAGYDIESYNSRESILIDRLIEVKSYSGSHDDSYFYWSENEMETAKQEGDKYFLYILNRDKLSNSNYTPEIIQNPYKEVFFDSQKWEKICKSHKFRRLTKSNKTIR